MKKVAQKRPTIGVLAGCHVYYGTILGNFIGPLLHGVCAAANDRQCNVLLACGMDNSYTQAHPAWPVPGPDVDYVPVGPWNTDGLIVFNPLLSEARSHYIQELIGAGHPVMFATAGEVGPTISIDNEGGIRQALLHLVAHGHRHIAFIAGYAGDPVGDSGIRLRAFESLAKEYNLTVDNRLIAYGNHGINGGQQAMRQILDAGVPFTAVLASNDESAIGAMGVLKEAGFRIPQDIAIIGFDDTLEAMTQVPPLTTLHGSPFRMGYQALESLLNHVEGKTETVEDVRVPMQLVIRQSCGCQPSAVPEFIFDGSDQSLSRKKDERAVISQLAQTMTETVLGGAQRLSLDEVRSRCRLLVDAFIGSLDRNNSTDFRLALEDTLARIEEMEDDTHVWYTALSTFESGLGLIREIMKLPAANQQPEKMVNEARGIIIQSMQRQHRRSVIHQKWITDQTGQLNARLFAALDEAQVYKILASHLPNVGIQNVGVAFFVEEDDDPVAHTSFRKVSEHDEPEQPGVEFRFPSRQFPPEDLYSEPYRLVLLPLAGQKEMAGFIAFDAANLEICGNIVWQLVTFLKVVRLYRDATDGRRLAEEANHVKSRFLSTVSHELRTPLNLIVGLSGMLLQDETASETGSYWRDIKRIHASAQHLDGLIQDVLDLTRDEMGQLKLVSEPLELEFVLKVVSTVGEQLVRDKGLEWQAFIPDELPKVWGDRTRLRQIVLNLISNAVKFTARGKVTFRVSVSEDTVTISVSDTGLGIAPEEQGIIFDEFRQTERTKARGYGGLGLGLAICKRLVEMHGGHIGVRSSGEEGSGSTFFFTLPVMEGDRDADKPEVMPLNQSVLLLAERSGNGEQLGKYLSRQGFDVETAWIDANTDRLSRWLKSPPGAVVLEQGTAAKQGWEILQLLKDNPNTQEVPVLFYSMDDEQNSGSLLELNYLTKPLNKTELIRALDRQGLKDTANDRREKTVLVVDDDPGTLDMHARIVSMWSEECRILKARNGKEALAIIKDAHPDLVLLDLMMPELDGFGVLEAIRSDERTRDIPVLVLTGQALTLDEMAKLNRGVTNVLGKGLFSMEETLYHVEAALARSKTLGNETQRIVRKAIAYLYEHYMESISLDDAARYVGMSKEYLARCFHQEMGVTLVTYLNRYRVKQAKIFLDEGERSLTEVALEIGFSSNTYFSRVFKQEVGMSPSEYKQISKQLRIQEKAARVYPS
jgi:signal transduction histidine kinase/DNA-binding LacI/PurR family transcriptional regulator/DNA-binding response OmpR family regulator